MSATAGITSATRRAMFLLLQACRATCGMALIRQRRRLRSATPPDDPRAGCSPKRVLETSPLGVSPGSETGADLHFDAESGRPHGSGGGIGVGPTTYSDTNWADYLPAPVR